MRQNLIRVLALFLGLAGAPALAWQIWHNWPVSFAVLTFYALQAVVIYVFLSVGLGKLTTSSDRDGEELFEMFDE